MRIISAAIDNEIGVTANRLVDQLRYVPQPCEADPEAPLDETEAIRARTSNRRIALVHLFGRAVVLKALIEAALSEMK